MKIRIFALVSAAVFGGFLLGFGSKLLTAPSFDQQVLDLRESAYSWLFSSVKDNGLFIYSLNPETGEYSAGNNDVRQLMASRILAQMSQTDPGLLALHKKNLNAWLGNWYREEDGVGYILYDEKSKLGANAALLRTLVASPLFEEYSDTANAVARGILELQNEDGSFEPWYTEPDYEYDRDYLLSYYSGEALTALTEYYLKTADASYLDAAVKSARFYMEKYVVNLEDNYYPTYVPWHSIAYANLYRITGDKSYAEAVFALNDKVLEIQDTTDYIGRFYNPETPQYGAPHSASDGVYTEGLVYAYEAAEKVGAKAHAQRYLEAIKLSVKNLYGLQYREPIESPLPFAAYQGSVKTAAGNPWVRVDNAQHIIDALTHLIEVLNI